MARKLKNVENETHTLQDLEYVKKTDQLRNGENQLVGPRIWQETLKIVENEIHTLWDLEHGKKTEKRGKMRNTHSRTWDIARNTD